MEKALDVNMIHEVWFLLRFNKIFCQHVSPSSFCMRKDTVDKRNLRSRLAKYGRPIFSVLSQFSC